MQLVRLSVDGILPIAQGSTYSILFAFLNLALSQRRNVADAMTSYSPNQLGRSQRVFTGCDSRVCRFTIHEWSGRVVVTLICCSDDYFVLLLDSGGSTMYSLSQRFTISKGGSPASGGLPSTVSTATVSGAPDPTMKFAATYGVSSASRTSMSATLCVGVGVICALWGVA